jgi:hypothetical protein
MEKLTPNLLTELRTYAIIPDNADQAQEVADWLVSVGEKVYTAFNTAHLFPKYPILLFDSNMWTQTGQQYLDECYKSLTRITATALFAKYRDNQMDEAETFPVDFVMWYTGMPLDKLKKAHERFIKEKP